MLSNDVISIIKQRRSIRKFNGAKVSDEFIDTIIDCAKCAPHGGDKALHFSVVTSEEMLKKINAEAKKVAQNLDSHMRDLGLDGDFNCLYNAPLYIIISASEETVCPETDCAAAMQNMIIAAESIGLVSCWIYFGLLSFHSEYGSELRNILSIPDGYRPYQSAVFGLF